MEVVGKKSSAIGLEFATQLADEEYPLVTVPEPGHSMDVVTA